MVSIMVNKITYKHSVKDIMDKYYEMFPDNNQSLHKEKKTFSTVPKVKDTDRTNETV
jgi:hypothetical protein